MNSLAATFSRLLGRSPQPAPVRHRILVIVGRYESALALAPVLEATGVRPTFLAAADLDQAEAKGEASGVLIVSEVETMDKTRACAYFRASERFARTPIAAVMAWTEGGIAVDADVVIRPPGSLKSAVSELRARIPAAGEQTVA